MTKIDDNFFSDRSEESLNIKENLGRYLFHWPVFAVGLILCLSSAFLYLRYTEEYYEVNTTLLIKDEKKGSTPGGDLLSELDLFGTSKVVDNEIEILKSKTLMNKVVNRLNLMIDYRIEGRLIHSDIYETKPVNIGVVQMDSNWYGKNLLLSFPSAATYLLQDLDGIHKVKGRLNELQRSVFGVYRVEKSESYKNWGSNTSNQIHLTISDPKDAANKYLSKLNVGLAGKQSSILELKLETIVPQRGKDILNNLVQVYNEAGLTDKNRTIQNTMDFIDIRLKLISGELKEVEKDVEGFKSTRGITNMSSDANLFLENIKANDAKMSEINLQISVVQDIQRYVNSPSAKEKLPSTLGINDPMLVGQITQLSDLQLQKDKLLATTGANNPLLEPLNSQIETTRANIKTSISNISQSLNNTKKNLQGTESQIQSSIKQIPGQERQLISIERQKSIKETIYLYLLQKKEEAQLSYAASVADSRVIDAAYGSKKPIKPKRELIYVAALILGLLLPIIYIYTKNLLNNKVESGLDIQNLTATPLLGEILFEEGSEGIVVTPSSRKAIAEQFRALRTNMQFLNGKQTLGHGRVTLLTSSMSGEGKSFVSSNIAAALAISGKKTILLELDLRKPKVSRYLNLDNKRGLSNYLIGKAEIQEIIQSTTINPNFFVIGSGPIPPNPSELLIQTEIETLFDYLRANFDEILIDTPPIGLVTDAQVLARLTDTTLYLVRQNVTFKQQIKNLEELYQSQKFPKLNVILNGVKMGGSYAYGASYGYGYYAEDADAKNKTLKTNFKNIFKRF